MPAEQLPSGQPEGVPTGLSALPVATKEVPQEAMPYVHLKTRLCFLSMPMGNRLPMPDPHAKQDSGEKESFADAHDVKGVSIEEAIQAIAKTAPHAMDMGELMLRRQIATTLLITMGRKITHFEGEIDPLTGSIDVDFKFTPIVSSDQHLVKTLGKYDPENDPEQRLKDCAIMRLYTHSIDPKTGDRFSHLLGCTAVSLVDLMEHSLNVTSSEPLYCFKAENPEQMTAGEFSVSEILKPPPDNSDSTPKAPLASSFITPENLREHDFALRTNFCNTFALCTVAPFLGKICTWGSPEYEAHSGSPEVHAGLKIVVDSSVSDFRKAVSPQIDTIRAEIAKLKGISSGSSLPNGKAYEKSVLHNLPDVQTVVKLQQALQQVR